MISRRVLLRGVTVAAASAAAFRGVRGQDRPRLPDTSNLFAMDQSAARSVRRPPKPGVAASMTPAERDALERQLRCQCGCTLDVYGCRTTDFSCQVSPSMHRDVLALVEGGYTAQEILDAFRTTYGERVLMTPSKEGFNWLAYLLPGTSIAAGAVLLVVALRRWQRPAHAAASAAGAVTPEASAEELARIEAAVRDDS